MVSEIRPGPDDLPAPIGLAPPITSDPPFHAVARRMLLPAFSPKAIAALEPLTRDLCRELLDATDGQAEIDAAVDYARHIPLRVIIGMLGFPQEDADIFRRFIRMVLEDVDQSEEERQEVIVAGEIDEYIDARIAEHQAEPQNDLTTFLLEAEIDGNKLEPDHVRGTMVLLMIAGIDTTWSAIGASLWHLAQHPDDRNRLATDPGPDAQRRGGAPAGLRARHHGPPRRRGLRAPRLPDEGGRLAAPALPVGQPRPRDVP